MVYRYDYDVKNNLIDLLETKQDFAGVLEMQYYLEQYHQETSTARQNLQRFLIYKLSYYLDDSDLKQFDCDVCEEMTTSYLKTYHWLDGYRSEQQPSTAVKYEVTNGDITYRGDTMTSAWIPIENYIQLKMSGQIKMQGNMWELYFLRNMEKVRLSPEAGHFLQLTHSIGNFIPVPRGFNTGRSGEYAKWDSWDLTLAQIFQWYTDNSDMTTICNHGALERLFTYAKNKESAIQYCEAWLQLFETWENFVKENYLEAFVDKKGVPKKFFPGHSLENPLPKTLKEYETFFQTVNKCIEQRGKQIANFLMNRENGAESMGKGALTFSFSDLQNAKETFLEYVYSFLSISTWKLKLLGFFLFYIIFSPVMIKMELYPLYQMIFFVAVIIFLAFLIIYFSLGAMYKCPTCKKRFVLKRIEENLVSSERISILQEVKTRNRNGNVVGTQEQYIPGTRRIYEIHYVCKNCGEDCYRQYEKETPNV